MTTTLTSCECGHLAVMHHFNGFADCKGQDGRGKCATCECRSFKAEKA